MGAGKIPLLYPDYVHEIVLDGFHKYQVIGLIEAGQCWFLCKSGENLVKEEKSAGKYKLPSFRGKVIHDREAAYYLHALHGRTKRRFPGNGPKRELNPIEGVLAVLALGLGVVKTSIYIVLVITICFYKSFY